MTVVTGYAAEQIAGFLTSLVWVLALLAMCGRFVYVGFTRYPWPGWIIAATARKADAAIVNEPAHALIAAVSVPGTAL